MAVGRLKVKLLAKYVSVVAMVYFLVAIIVTISRTDGTHPQNRAKRISLAQTPDDVDQSLHLSSQPIATKSCEEVHLAIVVTDTSQVTDYVQMLKTLFYYRDSPLVLHVAADPGSAHVMSTLLHTWAIPGLQPHYYTADMSLHKANDKGDLRIKLQLGSLLPSSVTKVIVISGEVRLAANIFALWKEFDQFTKQTVMGVHRSTGDPHYLPGLILMDLQKWRAFLQKNAVPEVMTSSPKNVDSWFETHKSRIHHLPCEWQLRPEDNIKLPDCLKGKRPQAFWWDEKSQKYTANAQVEQLKMMTRSVEQSDGELFRHSSSACLKVPDENVTVPARCAEFRYATRIKRRTHLYLHGHFRSVRAASSGPHDVSLVTQLTPDRFGVLERLAEQWEGPLHAVFHVTEQEARALPEMAQSSKVIKARGNVAFHAVFKRGKFYPINYLRNVGINESATPYTLFIDVDLLPNKGLYTAIKKRIPTDMKLPNETLVVPAFEAHKALPKFPNTKADLLTLMNDRTVEGYRMSKGWNLGHKPTNYAKWKTATAPYLAEFRDAFEPYVVLPTKDQPQFRETLLERMGDKLAYGRILYAKGYQFKVLPDQFVIHIPHPTSQGTNMWKSYPGYGGCSGVLFEEFRSETKKKYPWQKVH